MPGGWLEEAGQAAELLGAETRLLVLGILQAGSKGGCERVSQTKRVTASLP